MFNLVSSNHLNKQKSPSICIQEEKIYPICNGYRVQVVNTAEGTTVVLSEHVWHCAVSMSLVPQEGTAALPHCGAPQVAPCPHKILMKQLKREENSLLGLGRDTAWGVTARDRHPNLLWRHWNALGLHRGGKEEQEDMRVVLVSDEAVSCSEGFQRGREREEVKRERRI